MSLWDQIEADNSAVFFDSANGFGQEIVHISPHGSEERFVGNVDEEEYQRTDMPVDERGAVLRRMAKIDIPASIKVEYVAPAGKMPSQFIAGDDVWVAKNTGGRDSAQQTVVCQLIDRKSQKRAT